LRSWHLQLLLANYIDSIALEHSKQTTPDIAQAKFSDGGAKWVYINPSSIPATVFQAMGATFPPHLAKRFEGLLSWARWLSSQEPEQEVGTLVVYRLLLGQFAYGKLSAILEARVRLHTQSGDSVNEDLVAISMCETFSAVG
jgi:hypothetical protein